MTGGDGNTQIINPFPGLPPANLTIHQSTGGKFLGMQITPWGQSIRTTSSSVNTPLIETEIVLFNDQKKIDFRYKVHKDYTTRKEGVYFAFPVAVQQPEFTYATQQQRVDPASNLMRGGSLEWFNVQHRMAVRDSNLTVGIVPVDASLANFGDINRGTWPGKFAPKTGTLFSYVRNNYWHTNYRAAQAGEFTFRYVITSAAKFDGEVLTRLAMEEMRPAELNDIVSQDKPGDPPRPLPAQGEGFLDINADDLALITWKQAEDGKGTILRLQEIAGKPAETIVRFPHMNIDSAQLCSGVEETCKAYQFRAMRPDLPFVRSKC